MLELNQGRSVAPQCDLDSRYRWYCIYSIPSYIPAALRFPRNTQYQITWYDRLYALGCPRSPTTSHQPTGRTKSLRKTTSTASSNAPRGKKHSDLFLLNMLNYLWHMFINSRVTTIVMMMVMVMVMMTMKVIVTWIVMTEYFWTVFCRFTILLTCCSMLHVRCFFGLGLSRGFRKGGELWPFKVLGKKRGDVSDEWCNRIIYVWHLE